MKNYWDSDYAANEGIDGIVYQFTEDDNNIKRVVTVTVTQDDYLTANPDKTQEDFRRLKIYSFAVYKAQYHAKNSQTWKNVSISNLHHLVAGGRSLDEAYIDGLDKKAAIAACRQLLESGVLTEKQAKRFALHIFGGFSLRQIAKSEGVHFTSVHDSVEAANRKLKKIFLNLSE